MSISDDLAQRLVRATGDLSAGLELISVITTVQAASGALGGPLTPGTASASNPLVVDSNIDIAGIRNVTLTGTLTLGSTGISAAEIGVIDAVTAGTVAASKALVVDANKDLASLRNLTLTGALSLGELTIPAGGSTAATGTTAGDAATLPAGTSAVYPTTAADDAAGVILNAADKVTGRTLFIGNGVSNKVLKVYPPTGGTINGAGANAAFSSASGKGVIIHCLSGAGNTFLAW